MNSNNYFDAPQVLQYIKNCFGDRWLRREIQIVTTVTHQEIHPDIVFHRNVFHLVPSKPHPHIDLWA